MVREDVRVEWLFAFTMISLCSHFVRYSLLPKEMSETYKRREGNCSISSVNRLLDSNLGKD